MVVYVISFKMQWDHAHTQIYMYVSESGLTSRTDINSSIALLLY